MYTSISKSQYFHLKDISKKPHRQEECFRCSYCFAARTTSYTMPTFSLDIQLQTIFSAFNSIPNTSSDRKFEWQPKGYFAKEWFSLELLAFQLLSKYFPRHILFWFTACVSVFLSILCIDKLWRVEEVISRQKDAVDPVCSLKWMCVSGWKEFYFSVQSLSFSNILTLPFIQIHLFTQ